MTKDICRSAYGLLADATKDAVRARGNTVPEYSNGDDGQGIGDDGNDCFIARE